MFNEVVGQSESGDLRLITVVRHPFEHCRTHAAITHAILDGDDSAEATAHLVKQTLVERLQEAQVIVGNAEGFASRTTG